VLPTGVASNIHNGVAAARLTVDIAALVWPETTGPQLHAEADLYASLPLGPHAPWRHWLATSGRVGRDLQPVAWCPVSSPTRQS
jgi:hypothetical protein